VAKEKKRTIPVSKLAQAEITAQNTTNSIQSVKKKLRELNSKSHGFSKKKRKGDEDTEDVEIDDDAPHNQYPSVVIEKDSRQDKSSSSSSNSSSESSSTDSESSSGTENEKPERKKKPILQHESALSSVKPETVGMGGSENSFERLEQDQKDPVLPSSAVEPTEQKEKIEEKANGKTTHSMDNTSEQAWQSISESPQIVPVAVQAQKEVELKNLDSWTNLTQLDPTNDAINKSAQSKDEVKKDEVWSQFQNRDLQNKMREKVREVQEEKERQERTERELERRKLEEQRQKEVAEQEEKRKKEEEQAQISYQKEVAAKRAAEKLAREQESSSRNFDMMDQSIVMSSFETQSRRNEKPAILDMFKLKGDEDHTEKENSNKEDGEL